jgi:hypothetical protein
LLLLANPEAFEWRVYGKAVLLELGFDFFEDSFSKRAVGIKVSRAH